MTETTTIFTIAQFGMIALFAIIVIFGILFGMRLKRRRLHAEAEVEAHREAVEDTASAETEPPARDAATSAEPAARDIPAEIPRPTETIPASSGTSAPQVAPEIATAPIEPRPDPIAAASPGDAPVLAGDITQLKGLGPKLAATLAQLGITRVDQIAAMTPAQLADLDAQLGTFKGRPARDRWAEQAALLVAGDRAGYEAEFGKLG